MPKRKTTCPRCQSPDARPNAQGPDHVWCRKCGGLVPMSYTDDHGPYSDDPVESAIASERGLDQLGRKRSCRVPQRGGLHRVFVRTK